MKLKQTLGGLICFLLLNVAVLNNSFAQFPVFPVLADNALFVPPPGTTVERMNAAVLSYDNIYGVGQVFAVVEEGNGNPGAIIVGDRGSGFTIPIAYTYLMPLSNPDVIIGDTYMPTTGREFYLAASYTVPGGAIIDYYIIQYYLPGVFTIIKLGSSNIPAATSVHLDVIAQDQNVSPLPLCYDFVVTWDDVFGNVFVDKANLATPPVFFPTPAGVNLTAMSGIPGTIPDVAGIQRIRPGLTTVDDIALVTFVDFTTNNALYYVECNFGLATVSPITVLDNPSPFHIKIDKPRIDAIDFSLFSLWMPPTLAQYKVVAEVTDPFFNVDIFSYDNTTAIGGFNTTGFAIGMLPNPHTPCVAADLPGADYQVQQLVGAVGTSDLWFEPIQWTNSYAYIVPPINYYFRINTTSTLDNTGSVGADAISNCPNWVQRVSGGLLSVWTNEDLGPYQFTIYYKFDASGGGINNYFYRNANGKNSSADYQNSQWKVYPNPVKDFVIIQIGTDNEAPTDYIITDIVGSKILEGSISSIMPTQVNIKSLQPGSYLITLYKNNVKVGSQQLVKSDK